MTPPPSYPELPAEDAEFLKAELNRLQAIRKAKMLRPGTPIPWHLVEEQSQKAVEQIRQSLVKPAQWTPKSRRCGLIAKKLGMMQMWDDHGINFPVSVLRVEENHVIQVKPEIDRLGRVGVQVGAGWKKPRNVTVPLLGHFAKAGVAPKAKVHEFRVTPDAVIPVGTRLHARHFVPGQFVDVLGISRGHGFQGVMFRWGFGGQPASHGVSLTHRSLGSTGMRQDPGRTFRGKKMPGQTGRKMAVEKNLFLYKIDTQRDLLFIKGSVPGPKEGWVRIRDAVYKQIDSKSPPPFPTYYYRVGDEAVKELVAPLPKENPLLKV